MTSVEEIRSRVAAVNAPVCTPANQPVKWHGKSGGCRSCDVRVAAAIAKTDWIESIGRPFIVCPDCGYKRCPKATWHGNDCTGSNDPGQAASYPAAVLQEHALEDLEFLLGMLDGLAAAQE